jgi:chemotaxis protein methyltransferase CheR
MTNTQFRPTEAQRPSTITFSEAEFQVIAQFAHRHFGLNLPSSKKDMVYSRLIKRLRKLGLHDFSSYLHLLNSTSGRVEHVELLSALTTNVTQFFREKHHFDYLGQTVLPELIAKARSGKRVRLWSAGCSAGQEPYSMALTVLGQCPGAAKLDFKILASDIDPRIVTTAKSATYPREEMAALPEAFGKYAITTADAPKTFSIAPEVRQLISFAELNLIADWPFSGPFDAIFCRNVAIYFDAETQSTLWRRFAAMIPTNGHLFIGHSERLTGEASRMMKSVGVTVYQKTA